MPSIEVVCINQAKPLSFRHLPFAVLVDTSPSSHRGPKPLFRADFQKLRGCTYHLGSPFCAKPGYEGPFFAYELIQDNEDTPLQLRFADAYVTAVRTFLHDLLEASPAKRLLFTTDWQFGPLRARRFGPRSFEEFWRLHDQGRLFLNAAYPLVGSPGASGDSPPAR